MAIDALQREDEQALRRADGAAFLSKLKTAGLKDEAKAALQIAKHLAASHKPEIIGAAGITAAQYLLNRSDAQKKLTKMVGDKTEKGSFANDLSELVGHAADFGKKHPLRVALMTVPAAGAALGRAVSNHLAK